MGWELRRSKTTCSLEPQYDASSTLYTIELHYGGKFEKESCTGDVIYTNGNVAYFDHVDSDEMSILEVKSMAGEIGCTSNMLFYYSTTMPKYTNKLLPLQEDSDVLAMFNFESSRIVGVYIEQTDKTYLQNLWVIAGRDKAPTDRAPLEEPEARRKNSRRKHILLEEVMTRDIEKDGTEELVQNELRDNDCAISVGSDSEHSDFYVDSDGNYDLGVDEAEYDNYVDLEAEWGGLRQSQSTRSITRSQKLKVVKPLESHNMHEGKKVFNPKIDMLKVEFAVNMCFNSRDDALRAIKKHALDWKKDIKLPNNGDRKIQAKCKHDGCPWQIFVSRHKSDNSWIIRSLGDDHECPYADNIAIATPALLNELCGEELRLTPSASITDMTALVKLRLGLDVSEWQMYRLRKLVFSKDTEGAQYNLCHRYGEELLRTNDGSTVKIVPRNYANYQVFERMYMCLGGLKMGFLSGCRKVLMFDGCHMRNAFGGVLLTVVGLDPNNGMYPLAYAVVEKETYESWHWFLKLLVADLEIEKDDSHLWTVMSDKQKGLVKAVDDHLTYSEHRFCVFHLYTNFKQLHSGLTLKLLLWRAAKATRLADFERIMQELHDIDPKAYDWLSSKPAEQWSKAYFKTDTNSDLLLNNMSETQNKVLLKARKMAVVDMFEEIRLLCMKRICFRRKQMLSYENKICPRIQGLIHKQREMSHKFTPVYNGKNEFQVYGAFPDQRWVVKIKERTCTCRRWQLTGIPCAHAISSILKKGLEIEDHVHDCYSKATYLNVYNHFIHPIGPEDEWPKTQTNCELYPPVFKSAGGRPKKYARKLQPGEKKKPQKKVPFVKYGKLTKHGVKMTCSKCKEEGHNKAKCPNEPAETNEVMNEAELHGSRSNADFNYENEFVDDIFEEIDNYETGGTSQIVRDIRKGKTPVVEQPISKRKATLMEDATLIRRLDENTNKSVLISAKVPANIRTSRRLQEKPRKRWNLERGNLTLSQENQSGDIKKNNQMTRPIAQSQPVHTGKSSKISSVKSSSQLSNLLSHNTATKRKLICDEVPKEKKAELYEAMVSKVLQRGRHAHEIVQPSLIWKIKELVVMWLKIVHPNLVISWVRGQLGDLVGCSRIIQFSRNNLLNIRLKP